MEWALYAKHKKPFCACGQYKKAWIFDSGSHVQLQNGCHGNVNVRIVNSERGSPSPYISTHDDHAIFPDKVMNGSHPQCFCKNALKVAPKGVNVNIDFNIGLL